MEEQGQGLNNLGASSMGKQAGQRETQTLCCRQWPRTCKALNCTSKRSLTSHAGTCR